MTDASRNFLGEAIARKMWYTWRGCHDAMLLGTWNLRGMNLEAHCARLFAERNAREAMRMEAIRYETRP